MRLAKFNVSGLFHTHPIVLQIYGKYIPLSLLWLPEKPSNMYGPYIYVYRACPVTLVHNGIVQKGPFINLQDFHWQTVFRQGPKYLYVHICTPSIHGTGIFTYMKTIKINQMLVNLPYRDGMGYISSYIWATYNDRCPPVKLTPFGVGVGWGNPP